MKGPEMRITITWKAGFHPAIGFTGKDASQAWEASEIITSKPDDFTDIKILDILYAATNNPGIANQQVIGCWNQDRTHTALSTHMGPVVDGKISEYGDTIQIDDRLYEVADFGWNRIS